MSGIYWNCPFFWLKWENAHIPTISIKLVFRLLIVCLPGLDASSSMLQIHTIIFVLQSWSSHYVATSFYPFVPCFIISCPSGDIKTFDTQVEIDSNFLHILDGRSPCVMRGGKEGEEFDRNHSGWIWATRKFEGQWRHQRKDVLSPRK